MNDFQVTTNSELEDMLNNTTIIEEDYICDSCDRTFKRTSITSIYCDNCSGTTQNGKSLTNKTYIFT